MKKKIITSLIAMGIASSANAAIFTYEVEGNHDHSRGSGPTTLIINTDTGQGSIKGGNIDATFTGDFGAFTGGETPASSMFQISNLQGTRIVDGKTLQVTNPDLSSHPYKLILDGTGGINLWATWGENNSYGGYGDYIATTIGYTPPVQIYPSTSSGGLSSTGGTTHGSPGGTSPNGGGTDVPAPGALLLFGLGALGLVYSKRRRNNSASPASEI